MENIWTKTATGYAATGYFSGDRYTIDRTPGHRFALSIGGTEVRQGKLVDLKAAAEANEKAAAGGATPPKAAPKLRTHKTTPKPADQSAAPVAPVAATGQEHVAAVEATPPDAYPPVRHTPTGMVGLNVNDAGVIPDVVLGVSQRDPQGWKEGAFDGGAIPDYIPPEVGRPQPESPVAEYARQKAEGVVGPYVPATRMTDDEKKAWAAKSATFHSMTGVDPADDDADDSDVDTVTAPPDTGNPVGQTPPAEFRHPPHNVAGATTGRTQAARPNPVAMTRLHLAALRKPFPVTDMNGRPVKAWLGGVIR